MAITIEFDEDQSSPKFSFQGGLFTAVRTGWIAWEDLFAFYAEVFPGTITIGGLPSFGEYHRIPAFPQLQAESMEAEPEPVGTSTAGPDTNKDLDTLPEYRRAKMTIRYSTRLGQLPVDEAGAEEEGDPVPLLQHRWTSGGEFLTIENEGIFWKDSSTVNDWTRVTQQVPVGLFIPQTEHQMTWERVADPPFNAIRGLIGKVNNTRGRFSTGIVYIETFLFSGAELERTIFTDGARAWKLTYRFSERVVDAVSPFVSDTIIDVAQGVSREIGGWNHFWRKGDSDHDAGFYPIRLSQELNAVGPYKSGNLAPLFAVTSIEPPE